MVVDATNLFVSDDERLSPFDKYSQHTLSGRLKRKESFEKEKSYVTGIKSFSDNVSVSSSLNYRVTISERGLRDVPVTIAATRSILLLDSLPVSPRITDSRIAVFPTGKMLYSPTTQGARPIWYGQPLAGWSPRTSKPTGAGNWWTRSSRSSFTSTVIFPARGFRTSSKG